MSRKKKLKEIKEELIEDGSIGIDDAIEMTVPGASFEEEVLDMTIEAATSESYVDQFSPVDIQSGLIDTDNEGGVYASQSTGDVYTENLGGQYQGKTVKHQEGTFELSGFTASVNGKTTNIRAKFNNIDVAKNSINGSNFILVINGAISVANIVSGQPTISNEEVELISYSNGTWVKA